MWRTSSRLRLPSTPSQRRRTWRVADIFKVHGSVIPAGLFMGASGAFCAALMWVAVHGFTNEKSVDFPSTLGQPSMFSEMQALIVFLITFRATLAYNRFWEGATLIGQLRGEWINAVSSVMSFCSMQQDMKAEVTSFQNLLVRLMSLCSAYSIEHITSTQLHSLEVIDLSGIDQDSLKYLANSSEKIDVVMQWMQKLIVEGMVSGVIAVPAPVATRAFQELSRGIVNVKNCEKLTTIPFPFCFAQLTTVLTFLGTATQVLFGPFLLPRMDTFCLAVFLINSILWCINYVGSELESPFGADESDLPLADFQRSVNNSLLMLLEQPAQTPPKFTMSLAKEALQKLHGTDAPLSLFLISGSDLGKRNEAPSSLEGEIAYTSEASAKSQGSVAVFWNVSDRARKNRALEASRSIGTTHPQASGATQDASMSASMENHLRLIARDVRLLSTLVQTTACSEPRSKPMVVQTTACSEPRSEPMETTMQPLSTRVQTTSGSEPRSKAMETPMQRHIACDAGSDIQCL